MADSKSTWGGVLCIFGSHTFVPLGWSCKKHTAVSHSGTEAGVISLHAGLRLDGVFAFGLWDIVIDVSESQTQGNLMRNPKQKQHTSRNNGVKQLIDDPDSVLPNVHSSSQRASLFIIEDSDAVIKMTIKGQSPTTRHVSWTHRVDLDWLFWPNPFGSWNPNKVR